MGRGEGVLFFTLKLKFIEEGSGKDIGYEIHRGAVRSAPPPFFLKKGRQIRRISRPFERHSILKTKSQLNYMFAFAHFNLYLVKFNRDHDEDMKIIEK